jgi:3-oxoacyl-[acyl-carrier protein] reductase|tara:strand:- start:2193 stop:2936 length:744 start_codon:yes stop_codon:yes gene_type:complete
MLLKNKTAVVTGCNRGIGKKILEVFSANGATIIACVRNITEEFKTSLNDIKKKFNNQIIPVQFDLNDENQIKEAAKNILSLNLSIDILVNNAATIYTSLFQMTSTKRLKEVFETDFFSQTLFTQYILKSMIKKKAGNILYISSSSALDGNEGRSAYSAAKAAMIAQAKVLSREVGMYNIRVNTIAPGLTDTDMMRQSTPKEIVNEAISRISLKRIANPEEIANIALLLSSDLSNYITGQVIRVDGGM